MRKRHQGAKPSCMVPEEHRSDPLDDCHPEAADMQRKEAYMFQEALEAEMGRRCTPGEDTARCSEVGTVAPGAAMSWSARSSWGGGSCCAWWGRVCGPPRRVGAGGRCWKHRGGHVRR